MLQKSVNLEEMFMAGGSRFLIKIGRDPKHCLLAFITGSGPVSLIPSGLDSTIPIEYPECMPLDAKLFISSLLQVSIPYYVIFKVYPGNRLGARYLAGSILCNILGVSWE